jgi:hypothetical protein
MEIIPVVEMKMIATEAAKATGVVWVGFSWCEHSLFIYNESPVSDAHKGYL